MKRVLIKVGVFGGPRTQSALKHQVTSYIEASGLEADIQDGQFKITGKKKRLKKAALEIAESVVRNSDQGIIIGGFSIWDTEEDRSLYLRPDEFAVIVPGSFVIKNLSKIGSLPSLIKKLSTKKSKGKFMVQENPCDGYGPYESMGNYVVITSSVHIDVGLDHKEKS